MDTTIPRFDSQRPVPNFYGRRFLRFAELVEIGVINNRVQLNNLIEAGLFPPPIYLSPRRPLWDAEELTELIERRRAERNQNTPERKPGHHADDARADILAHFPAPWPLASASGALSQKDQANETSHIAKSEASCH